MRAAYHIATTEALNILANMPNVRESLGVAPNFTVDLCKFYERERNIALTCQHGGMLFPHLHEGVFEAHFMFRANVPGPTLKRCAEDMLGEMFTKYRASVIKGSPPRDNRAVRHLGYALGFRRIENSCFTDGLGRICDIYEKRL